MPAIPVSLLEPVWVEFAALLPERPEFHPDHPLGCHRRRIPDRMVFEHLKWWHTLQRHTGRRDLLPDIIRAVTGLASDRAAAR